MKERERALRKRKEREEQEVERVRQKARRKEAVESYQALLVETIKDPQVLISCILFFEYPAIFWLHFGLSIYFQRDQSTRL